MQLCNAVGAGAEGGGGSARSVRCYVPAGAVDFRFSFYTLILIPLFHRGKFGFLIAFSGPRKASVKPKLLRLTS